MKLTKDKISKWRVLMKKVVVILLTILMLFSLFQGALRKNVVKADESYQWISVNSGLYGGIVRSLAINPTNTQVIYAGIDSSGIFKSIDGGNSWTQINNGLTGIYVNSIVIDPINTNIVYAGTNDGVFKSVNNGAVWVNMTNVLKSNDLGSMLELPNLTTYSIAVNPRNTNTIYAGICNKLFKSTDGGNNWLPASYRLVNTTPQCVAIDQLNTNNIYLGTWGIPPLCEGVIKSKDGGVSWSEINNGLMDNFFKTIPPGILSIAIDNINTNTIYTGTDSNGIFKSVDGGNSWTQIGLTDSSVRSLVIDPINSEIIYAGTSGGVFKSTNGGSSWDEINNRLSASVYSLAIDPTNTQIVYAGTPDTGLFKLSATKFFIITSSFFLGGSISHSGNISVNFGANQTFMITPDSGYHIADVKVDGVSVGAVSTYTFTNVTSNHSIEVLFEKNQQNIIVKLQIGNKIMIVNGVENQLDAAPEIKNERTFLPLRAISEAFGAKVVWLPDTQGVTITLGENNIGLQIGNTSGVINNNVMILDAAPYIKNSRTMVPLRFIAEGLGAQVEWDGTTRTVTLTINQLPIASFTMNPTTGTAPLEVTFNASSSYDTDGTIVSYAWDFEDGNSGSGVTVKHTFNSKGSYNIKLTVTDNKGATAITIKTITITETLTFCQIGVPYIAADGLTVVLNSLTITEKSGSYQYSINYTLTNNTADKAIDEGTFKMYYKNESGGLPQYGFFDKLFPGDTRNRTYTFEELKSKPFDVLEYSSDNFFSPEPLVNSLKWEVHVP